MVRRENACSVEVLAGRVLHDEFDHFIFDVHLCSLQAGV